MTRHFASILTITVLFLTISVAEAQFAPGRYIVQLAEPPAASAVQALQTRTVQSRQSTLLAAQQRIRAMQARVRTEFEAQNVHVLGSTDTVANTLTVQATDTAMAVIAQRPDVVKVYRVRLFKPVLDKAVEVHNIRPVWDRVGVDHSGTGMKIGIIDTGIDNTHPGFQEPSLPMPEGFPKVNDASDVKYTSAKIIVARSYASLWGSPDPDTSVRDHVGHGTALAMTAAGVQTEGPLATIQGVAPQAYLGNYKIFGTPGYNDSAPDDAILTAIEDAVKDGMDVINLSLGSIFAPTPDNDILVQGIEQAEQMGVICVMAAGNDGPDKNTISSPADSPSGIGVGASENGRVFASPVSVVNGATYAGIPGSRSDGAPPVSGPLVSVMPLDSNGLACGTLPAGSLQGKIALILRGICTFEQKLNTAQGAGAIAAVVYTNAAQPTAVPMNVGAATLPAVMVDYSSGVALQALFTGDTTPVVSLAFTTQPVPSDPYITADFSSVGPGPLNIMKPDLVAVGDNFYTATQNLDPFGDMYSADRFILTQGTSFSSPLVAGSAALLKSLRPGLTAADYKSLLVNFARPTWEHSDLTMQQIGTGVLNVIHSVDGTLSVQPTSLSLAADSEHALVSQTIKVHNLSSQGATYDLYVRPILCDLKPTLSATSLQIPANGTVDLQLALDTAPLDPGAYQGYVEITDPSTGLVSRVPYWFAKPTGTVDNIQVLFAATTVTSGVDEREALLFRVLDKTGLALRSITPTVTFIAGAGGTVTAVEQRDDDAAGSYGISARFNRGTSTMRVQAGDQTADFTIRAR